MKYISSLTLLFSVLALVSAYEAPLDANPETTYALTLREDLTRVLDSHGSRLIVEEDAPTSGVADVGGDNGRKFMFPDGIRPDGEQTKVKNMHEAENGYLLAASRNKDGTFSVDINGKEKDVKDRGVFAVNAGVGIKLRFGTTMYWLNSKGTLDDEGNAAIWMLNPTNERTRKASRITGRSPGNS